MPSLLRTNSLILPRCGFIPPPGLLARRQLEKIARPAVLLRRPLQYDFAFGLDGHVTGTWSSGTSFATSALTTANAGDVIVAFVMGRKVGGVAVTSLSTTGVVWQGTARKTVSFNAGLGDLELWYGVASATLTAQATTINLNGTPLIALASVFGVSGANTSSISDSNVSLPATATGSSSVPTTSSVSTSNANDIIIAGVGELSNTTQGAGTGFTLIDAFTGAGTTGIGSEYQVVSSTQSSISVKFTLSSTNWAMIVDAIQQASTVTHGGQMLTLQGVM